MIDTNSELFVIIEGLAAGNASAYERAVDSANQRVESAMRELETLERLHKIFADRQSATTKHQPAHSPAPAPAPAIIEKPVVVEETETRDRLPPDLNAISETRAQLIEWLAVNGPATIQTLCEKLETTYSRIYQAFNTPNVNGHHLFFENSDDGYRLTENGLVIAKRLREFSQPKPPEDG